MSIPGLLWAWVFFAVGHRRWHRDVANVVLAESVEQSKASEVMQDARYPGACTSLSAIGEAYERA